MPEKQALSRLKSRHWYMPLLILTNIGLLIAGWSLPTLKLTKVIFFTSTYSIWAGIVELWKSHHCFLAALIFFFSMIFPTAKLLSLLAVWFVPLTYEVRTKSLNLLEIFGRWSMLDVYVVAVLIVLIKAGDIVDANAAVGIYMFAAAIFLSLLTTNLFNKLAKQQ